MTWVIALLIILLYVVVGIPVTALGYKVLGEVPDDTVLDGLVGILWPLTVIAVVFHFIGVAVNSIHNKMK